MSKKIIFSSGGTGGHIFPSISIIQYFLEKKYEALLVTDRRGAKFLKNNSQIKLCILDSDTPFNKNFYKKIFSYIKIIRSIIKSFFLLKKEKADLVFGLGGYVSFPMGIAAKFLNIPLVIYENNIFIGRTNNYLLPLARQIFIANQKILNCPEKYNNKICHVGHILRKEILNSTVIEKERKKNIFSILILGGSQGAEIFGQVVPKVIKKINELGHEIKINHQCVREQKESLIQFYENNKIQGNVFEFSNEIFKYILDADIAISRSGASTSAELIYLKTPFIAVPYPYAMDNHQYLNAKTYSEKGYCWLIKQSDFTDDNLFNLIIKIIKDRSSLDRMKKNMNQNESKFTNNKIENAISRLLRYEN